MTFAKSTVLVLAVIFALTFVSGDVDSYSGGGCLSRGSQLPRRALSSQPYAIQNIVRTILNEFDEGQVGRQFENREGCLPAGGSYYEYDVYSRNDSDRIVAEYYTSKVYYTPDHYWSFIQLQLY